MGSTNIDDSSEDEQTSSETDDLEVSTIINLDLPTDKFDHLAIITLTTIDLIQPDDLLPLRHLELID